ncbi:serine hydrolase [uncultured Alsobacter sp.]|uniref:serine hydrolase domain-containing protein n=1 Tax=uncultured Alsobacter sp. TaxID=1748258 RepID=UPI0025D19804|nr:serine hydrolase [uncultured Alsobacter sp.]
MGNRWMGLAVAAALVIGSAGMARAQDSDPVAVGLMQGYPLAADKQVTLRNWLVFPFNRWAFRHVRELFPTGEVARTAETASRLRRGEALAVDQIRFEAADGKTVTAAEHFRREFIDGFIVLHRGRLVYEGLFSSMQASDRHLWQSMTKSFTGLLAEILIEQGKLDPARTAADYVPDLRGTPWGAATLRHLLDMEVNVEEPSTRAAELPPDFWSKAHFLDALRDSGATQKGPNGTAWFYTNNAPQTVGLVMAKVTGQSWHGLARDLVWAPLRTEASGDIWLDTQGQAAAAGGFSSTLRDAARFGQMMADGGKVGGRQVVPAAVIERLGASAGNAARTAAGNVLMLRQQPKMSYRSYWYQVNDGTRAIEGLGIFGQHLHVNPAERLVIVQFGSFTGPGPDPRNWTRLVEAIRAALRNR